MSSNTITVTSPVNPFAAPAPARTVRVGRRMADVIDYVTEHPACVAYAAAKAVQPNGRGGTGGKGHTYGYATVHRAVRAGLVYAVRGCNGHIRLYPVVGA